jgi:heat shock protein HslJ
MKTIFAAALSTLALTACTTYPSGPAPYPPGGPVFPSGVNYRATGTEPFWSLDIGRDMTFVDRGNGVTVVQPTPPPNHGVAGEIYQTPRINANIVHAPCSDGMSDRTYPDQVQVRVDGREYRGCGAPTSWYGWNGEGTSAPGNGGATALSNTNWRVAAVNGEPTPVSGPFFMNFESDSRLGAKFGCNSMGAGYSQTGATLTVGAVMATRMACPDMHFESAASAILARPLTVSGYGSQVTLTSSAGSIALVRR